MRSLYCLSKFNEYSSIKRQLKFLLGNENVFLFVYYSVGMYVHMNLKRSTMSRLALVNKLTRENDSFIHYFANLYGVKKTSNKYGSQSLNSRFILNFVSGSLEW